MAEITGSFPSGVFGTPHASIWKKENGVWKYQHDGLGFFETDFIDICSRHDPMRTGIYRKDIPGAWDVKVSGTPLPLLPQKLIEGPKIRNKNSNFKARQKRGEMIVSDYQNSSVRLTYKNGGIGVVERTGRVAFLVHSIAKAYYGYTANATDIFSKDGQYLCRMPGTYQKTYEYRRIAEEVNPIQVGWVDGFATGVLARIFDVDETLKQRMWTNVLSEANSATADILTAIAEAPKTFEQIIDLVKSIFTAFIAVKNKELRLRNKSKRVRAEYIERIRRNNFESNALYVSARNERTRRKIEADRLRKNKQLANDMKLQLEEITSAVTQVWLTFRYSITPNAILIRDLAEAYQKHDRIYNRWTDADTFIIRGEDLDLPSGWVARGELSIVCRAFIKRRFDAQRKGARWAKEFSYDLLSTAWELIPLSFVIDWFLNVGDLVRSLTSNNVSSYTQVATFSSKVDSTLVFKHETSGCQVLADYSGYDRTVVTRPEKYCTLLFEPHITDARAFDALALSWSIFGKKFSKSINLFKG